MSDCCDPITPPSTCPKRCNPYVDACCVVDESAYACIGIEADSTQCDINAALVAAVCQSACVTYTDVAFIDASGDQIQWLNNGGKYQTVQHSDVKQCTVRLRGVAVAAIANNPGGQVFVVTNILTLPVGYRPALERIFSINVLTANNVLFRYQPGFLIVKPSGIVSLEFNINSVSDDVTLQLSLDGIYFEISPI